MAGERKSPLRLGPKPPPDPDAPPKAPRKSPQRRAKARPVGTTLAATSTPAVVEPTGPMAGFDQFAASDYAVAVPGQRNGETRYLTVSPLRAIMDEQAAAPEHIVTARTRQGVLYGAGLGMERSVIARIMGVELAELEQLYPTELATAVHLMMNDVQTNLYNIARDPAHSGAVRAGMFMLGKLGNELFKEEKRGSALVVDPRTRTIDPALLSDEQREDLRQILMSAMRLANPVAVDTTVEAEYDDVDEEDIL